MDDPLSTDREKQVKSERPRGGFWREIFIVSITIIFTVNGTLSIERSVGYDIDGYRHPLACQLLEWTFLVPQLFLLIFSPFFFRRLGILGKLGWASAFVVLVWTIALMGRA